MVAKKLKAESASDPVEAAEQAGLRYVSDDRAGYMRKPKGKQFEYFDTEGKPIRDDELLLRIKRLAIPPAWTDVWICPLPNGHIQATGRDARRRKQYRYHDRWREVRDENKYDRMVSFARVLPKIRRRVARDLRRAGLPREKVLATVVQLLERTFIRIGNDDYARQNKSYGLTTMQNRHVEVKGTRLRFRFRGKSGRYHQVDFTDRRIAKVISRLQDLPGQELFQFVDDDDEIHDITSQDVNDYLREITDEEFTAKDFRTWAGTVLAAMALHAQEKFETKNQGKTNVRDAIAAVAKILGNTPAICRKCYVHPAIIEKYLQGNSLNGMKGSAAQPDVDLRASEAAVLKFLERRAGVRSGN
ncbi:MAG: DNA topoisomerase IB [Chthoniobacterales bacterium]